MNLKDMLRASSRTFAIGIERLPKDLSHALTIAYLLLRVSDYLEDNAEMPPQQKVRLLYLWDKVLGGELPAVHLMAEMTYPSVETPDSLVASHADYLYQELMTLPEGMRLPILKHVRDSTIGMARWVSRGPLVKNEADMDDYMHEVAGRVGYLVTELFAWYSNTIRLHLDQLTPLAREFGLALQTVNVIRGLRDDYERGWIFVPESFCDQVNLPREALFDPSREQDALVVVNMLIQKAERHLEVAKTYQCNGKRSKRLSVIPRFGVGRTGGWITTAAASTSSCAPKHITHRFHRLTQIFSASIPQICVNRRITFFY
jgi:phytoene/squalene synthetase